MPVPPDTETNDDGSSDDGDGKKHRPDVEQPVHGGVDEKTAKRKQEAEFQDFRDKFLWRFQALHPFRAKSSRYGPSDIRSITENTSSGLWLCGGWNGANSQLGWEWNFTGAFPRVAKRSVSWAFLT